jgi:hypothetical protein
MRPQRLKIAAGGFGSLAGSGPGQVVGCLFYRFNRLGVWFFTP